jgi:hypothetical protein
MIHGQRPFQTFDCFVATDEHTSIWLIQPLGLAANIRTPGPSVSLIECSNCADKDHPVSLLSSRLPIHGLLMLTIGSLRKIMPGEAARTKRQTTR